MSTPGPTVPRWRLGRQLTQLREAAGVTQEEVARLLGCSLKTARRMEHGEVSVARGDLLVLLERYAVHDQTKRDELLDLQKRGRQRAWWSTLGPFYENNTTALLEFESAATVIRTFEPLAVPGLLQTEGYVRAINAAYSPSLSAEELDQSVELRLIRQEKLLKDDPPELHVILDEAVVRRPVGSPEVHRGQLERLLTSVTGVTQSLQLVPTQAGLYSGLLGAFTIFEFAPDVRGPVLYVEGHAGNLYVEDPDEVNRCLSVFEGMRRAALTPAETRDLLATMVSELIIPHPK